MNNYDAMIFARAAHAGQKRKYTGIPYVTHLAEVAGIVATCDGCKDYWIATAWLHDCIEDCGVKHEDLANKFGLTTADGVLLLSDLEAGNRAERKAASRARLAKAPGWIQTIKCADLISNTCSIVGLDPDFAEVYLEEKKLLLDVLEDADEQLRELAYSYIPK